MAPALTLLSVIIPARDEEASLPATVRELHRVLRQEDIPHEIVVVRKCLRFHQITPLWGDDLRRLQRVRDGVTSRLDESLLPVCASSSIG